MQDVAGEAVAAGQQEFPRHPLVMDKAGLGKGSENECRYCVHRTATGPERVLQLGLEKRRGRYERHHGV